MGFLTDQEQKRYFYHMALLLLLASTFAIVIWAGSGRQMKHVLLNHDKCVISSLMEQGVDEAVIEEAFVKGAATEEGAAFLGRMGIQEETEIWFLPDLWEVQKETGLWIAGLFLCLWGGLLLLAAFFFSARERIYEKAIRLIDRFMEGDFSGHLPRMEEGGLCRLFEKVDGLANALFAGNEEAVRAKEFLRDTISDISHQTKTPISNIMLYSQLLEEKEKNPELVPMIEAIREQSEKLDFLIQSLIKTSRLENEVLMLQPVLQPVAPMLRAVVSMMQEEALKKQIKIILEDTKAQACFDRKWTEEAVGNLLDNAVKYSPSGSRVQIKVTDYEMFVAVNVTDQGIGIMEEEQAKIFQRFYRSKETAQTKGVGIGLYLAREIAERQNGYLKVKSQHGKGSTFSFYMIKNER